LEDWLKERFQRHRGNAEVIRQELVGEQTQSDFGEKRAWIGEKQIRVHLFVATLGYSRCNFAMAFGHQRQDSWLRGIEAAFAHFVETREVQFNERFPAFCRDWRVVPKACAPYRARTKGKDENGVGYVEGNAIAGRRVESCVNGHPIFPTFGHRKFPHPWLPDQLMGAGSSARTSPALSLSLSR
jgi:transposase